jgi:hypothetical protein
MDDDGRPQLCGKSLWQAADHQPKQAVHFYLPLMLSDVGLYFVESCILRFDEINATCDLTDSEARL